MTVCRRQSSRPESGFTALFCIQRSNRPYGGRRWQEAPFICGVAEPIMRSMGMDGMRIQVTDRAAAEGDGPG